MDTRGKIFGQEDAIIVVEAYSDKLPRILIK